MRIEVIDCTFSEHTDKYKWEYFRTDVGRILDIFNSVGIEGIDVGLFKAGYKEKRIINKKEIKKREIEETENKENKKKSEKKENKSKDDLTKDIGNVTTQFLFEGYRICDCFFEDYSKDKYVSIKNIKEYPLNSFRKENKKYSQYYMKIFLHKKNLSKELRYAEKMKNKGARLAFFVYHTSFYSIEETQNLINKLNELYPEMVVLNDDDCETEGFFEQAELYINKLNNNCKIGYHGANYEQSIGRIKRIINNANSDKTLAIEATMGGIGFNYENIDAYSLLAELNKCYGTHYNKEAYLELFDLFLEGLDIVGQTKTKMSNLVAETNGIKSLYTNIWANECESTLYMIDKVSASLKQKNKPLNSDVEIKEYYKTYCKTYWNNTLALIVITANREKVVEYWLKESLKQYDKYGIDLIIYDSSSNEKTKEVVEKYQENSKVLKYSKWNGKYNGISIDEKVLDAYKQFGNKYEYLMPCRDGLLINIGQLIYGLDYYIRRKVDFVVINDYCRDYKTIRTKNYTNPAILFKEQCVQMTVLGSIIFRSDYILDIISKIKLDDKKNVGMWLPIGPFEYMAGKKIRVSSLVCSIYIPNLNSPRNSFWTRNLLWQWGERWCDMIDALPDEYNKYKAEVLKVEMTDFHPFSPLSLLRARYTGGLSFRKFFLYEKYIPRVCDTPKWIFFVICFCPGVLIKWIDGHNDMFIYKRLKGIYLKIKNANARRK